MPSVTSRAEGHRTRHTTVPWGPVHSLASVQPMLGSFTVAIQLHSAEKTALTI